MSTIKSSNEHLTLNADGSSKDIKFQANGVEKASISSAGAFTSTTIDATKLTGALPAIDGSNLTGVSSVGGATGVDFNDNTKIRLGTGNDLEIYHDASNSYIKDAGTGSLKLLASKHYISNADASKDHIIMTDGGAVDIYHNNSRKLITTSGGITVTGEITIPSDGKLQSTAGYMQVLGEDSLYLKCDTDSAGGESIYFYHGSQLVMQMQNNKTIDSYSSSGNWSRMMYAGGTGTQYYHSFRLSNNTQVGYINTDGSSTSYNTSSDYRLKENVDYTWDATTRLKQLKPARFNWIADDTNTLVDGFIAHEVSSIVPEAISGEKDAMEAAVLYKEGDDIPEGKSVGDVKFAEQISPQSIDQAKLVPLLVKTIQELEARITALEG